MTLNSLLFGLVLVQMVSLSLQVPVDLYEGSRCRLQNGDRGLCRLANDCPGYITFLRNWHPNTYIRCGFSGIAEIICCKDSFSAASDPDEMDEELIFYGNDDDDGQIMVASTSTTGTPSRSVETETNMNEMLVTRRNQQACIKYSNEVPVGLSFHILGGENTMLGEFPHMAALGFPKEGEEGLDWNCGGTLISDNMVLTAAHCVVNPDGRVPTRVRLGKVDLIGNTDGAMAEDVEVQGIITHPNYRRSTNLHDLALLRLAKAVVYSQMVGPACLQNSLEDPPPTAHLIVTGWGTVNVSTSEKSPTLLKANLTSVPLSVCNSSYNVMPTRRLPNGLTTGMVCAVDPDGRSDSCAGDSGGPLQTIGANGKYTIVGVTSFGIACGGGTPGVYARVAAYLDWIESVVWP